MEQYVLISLAAAACARTAATTPEPAAATHYTVLMAGNRAGEQTVTPTADGALEVRHVFNDRGRGPDLTTRYRLRADGIPESITTSGIDYFKSPTTEELTIAGTTARWRSRSVARAWHVGLVAMEVIAALEVEPAGDPDLAVQCALLHDTIEDTAITYDDVVAAFGVAVADGVRALPKDPRLPKAEAMANSLRRIRDQPREVWLVKLADRITNLEAPPAYWSRDKRARYRDEAMDILAALGAASPYLARGAPARGKPVTENPAQDIGDRRDRG